jgi:alkanesulfonate monooxygenase SsuD/methylene tetrahydromethanopterin reductase-like flavin-dependent oxidoreductase (luciferase family)
VIDGFRHFGFKPADDDPDGAEMAREHTRIFLKLLGGEGFAEPNPRPMFPNPPGLLRLEPHSDGLRRRIWWGAGSDETARWAARLGMNMQTSTLKWDEHGGEPLHVQQRKQIEAFRDQWAATGWDWTPRVSVSRSIFALVTDQDRQLFGHDRSSRDSVGFIDASTRAIFGRTYADAPDRLIEQLRADEALAAADTVLLTIPSQLGVEYNLHALTAILEHIAPALGWR